MNYGVNAPTREDANFNLKYDLPEKKLKREFEKYTKKKEVENNDR